MRNDCFREATTETDHRPDIERKAWIETGVGKELMIDPEDLHSRCCQVFWLVPVPISVFERVVPGVESRNGKDLENVRR